MRTIDSLYLQVLKIIIHLGFVVLFTMSFTFSQKITPEISYSINTDTSFYVAGDTVQLKYIMINQSDDTIKFESPTSWFFDSNVVNSDTINNGIILNTTGSSDWVIPPEDSIVTYASWSASIWFNFHPPGVYYFLMKPWYKHDSLEYDSLLVEFAYFSEIDTLEMLQYYPMHIGDKWQYKMIYYTDPWNDTLLGFRTDEITGDTVMSNGKRYYIKEIEYPNSTHNRYLRIDTLSMTIYRYHSGSCDNNEVGIYKLAAAPDLNYKWVNCEDSEYLNTFVDRDGEGFRGPYIQIERDWFLYESWLLKRGLGLYQKRTEEGSAGYNQLIAANINGKQYGEFLTETGGYFPISINRWWSYSNSSEIVSIKIRDVNSGPIHTYYWFNNYRWEQTQGYGIFRLVGDKVIARIGGNEYTFYDFSAEIGSNWIIPFSYNDSTQTTMTLLDTNETVITQLGTFTDCYKFAHYIGDDNEYIEWFAKEVGLVQRDIVTISGVERWKLIDTNFLSTTADYPVLLPNKYSLFQNFPNPFNPVTTIRYELPQFSHVRLAVYDILGREVAVLGDREEGPGVREVHWNASTVPSGIYFVQMQAGDFRQVRKVMLLK